MWWLCVWRANTRSQATVAWSANIEQSLGHNFVAFPFVFYSSRCHWFSPPLYVLLLEREEKTFRIIQMEKVFFCSAGKWMCCVLHFAESGLWCRQSIFFSYSTSQRIFHSRSHDSIRDLHTLRGHFNEILICKQVQNRLIVFNVAPVVDNVFRADTTITSNKSN